MSTPPPAAPPRVQIQTQAGCNGRCIFCPNADVTKSGIEMGRMSFELFQRIIDQIAETGPRRIMPYLQNEPLGDQRIPEFVQYIAERIPAATTLITTNGTKLTEEMGERLVDAGLKRLKVSLQSLDDEVNRAIMGYDATPVVENVLAFKRLLKRKRSKLDLRVSMIVTSCNAAEINVARRFWKRHGVRLVTSALENRGGNIENAEELNPGKAMARMGDCIRPSREMCVLFDGRVVLCCVDWYRTVVAGDLSTQTVSEVWNGPVFEAVRKGLRGSGGPELPDICIRCTESACPDEHRRGVKHLWKRCKAVLVKGPAT